MPLFDYRCRDCASQFEWLQSRAGDDPVACPQCGGAVLDRVLSVFAIPSARAESPAGPCGSAECACRRTAEA